MAKTGDRVRLIHLDDDPWSKLKPGSVGTVTHTDDIGTVHVQWDSGEYLGLLSDHDKWEILP